MKVLAFRQKWFDHRHLFEKEPEMLQLLLVHSTNLMIETVLENLRFANLARLHNPAILEKIWTHLLDYANKNKAYTYTVLDKPAYLAELCNVKDSSSSHAVILDANDPKNSS